MKKSFLALLVITIVVGFLAGVVGELWLNGFLMPDPYLNFKNYSDLNQKIDELLSNQNTKKDLSAQDLTTSETIGKVRPMIVSLYGNKNFSPLVHTSLLDSDYLGNGIVITNDGWIMTHKSVVPSAKAKYLVSTEEHELFQTEQIVLNGSGVVFIKIPANNLSVAEFGLRENLVDGQTLFLFGEEGNILQTALRDLSYSDTSSFSRMVRSTEGFYKFMLVNETTNEYVGSPVVSLEGKVIGMLSDKSGLVVPMDHLTQSLKRIVQGEAWNQPYLGLKYYDLTEVLNTKISQTRGAMVLSNYGVMADSPAKTIILPGDIIIRVEGEELGEMKNLTEVLSGYQVDDEIEFTLLRGDEEIMVKVILGEK